MSPPSTGTADLLRQAHPELGEAARRIADEFDALDVLDAVLRLGAGLEEHGRAADRRERPVAVGRRVDGALLDDVADDHVAVGVRTLEDRP